jgi:hypothetical protein
VAEICQLAREFVNLSDFERMDGTKTGKLREEFDRALLRAIFAREVHELVLDCHSKVRQCKASDRWGNKYETGETQLSGSPDTTAFNTIHDAFIAFCGLRAAGLSVDEAWNRLGVYVGDDGVTPDLDPEKHAMAAARWGFRLKASGCRRSAYSGAVYRK